MQNIVCLDVETGGLNARPSKKEKIQNPITQIGLIVFEVDKFKQLESYETFVKNDNDWNINPNALEASRVTIEEIRSGIPQKELPKKLIEIFTRYKLKGKKTPLPIILGHNVRFDMGFLEVSFELINKNLYDFVDPYPIDTIREMQIHESMIGKKETIHKLEACCERMGINLNAAHGAMYDVIATLELFKKIKTETSSMSLSGDNAEEKTIEKSRKFFQLI